MKYYLGIDIGASSGRHILAYVDEGQLYLEEIYRFSNQMIEKEGHFYWDIDRLYQEVLTGIKECAKQGKIPTSLGIDTWAVDYTLLDSTNQRLHDVYAYRDNRVVKGIEKVNSYISKEELYLKTGIQYQSFNTIYQLASETKEDIMKAKSFLMIPDYLTYLLTGKKVNEYTNFSTTQLLKEGKSEIDTEMIKNIGIDENIFQELKHPGTIVGKLKDEIASIVGLQCNVVMVASHDTASAYLSSIKKDEIILSSGTWSLLGLEINEPIITEDSRLANYTNEGGYNYRYRFLKNIMGLWIIQEVAKVAKNYSFPELISLAKKSPFDPIFDVNDERFLKPKNMVTEIISYFEEKKLPVPISIGEIAYCVFHSLAHSYQQAICELETITGKKYNAINIVGGGCQNELLNEMISKLCGKRVLAGPVEATAIGNIVMQLIADQRIPNIEEGRNMIKKSFEIKEYAGGKVNEYKK